MSVGSFRWGILRGFDGGLFVTFYWVICLIIYIYSYFILVNIGLFHGWAERVIVVDISLFTWCFVVVCG